MKKIMQLDSTTRNKNSKSNENNRLFIETNLVESSKFPSTKDSFSNKLEQFQLLGFFRLTEFRLLSKSYKKRINLVISFNYERFDMIWSRIQKRKHYSKITDELKRLVFNWMNGHPCIINISLVNDTLLLKKPYNTKEKFRIAKKIREISIREMHIDLISNSNINFPQVYEENDKVLISDAALISIIPPNIKKYLINRRKCVFIRFLLRKN